MKHCLLLFSLVFSQSTQTIELHSGANLISFYILPEDASLNNVLSPLGDNATGIIGEGVAGSHLGGGVWVGSLSEIDPTAGYWLKVDADDVLIVNGSPVDPHMNFELHSGQNLISYPNSDNLEVTLAIPDEYELGFIGIIS